MSRNRHGATERWWMLNVRTKTRRCRVLLSTDAFVFSVQGSSHTGAPSPHNCRGS
jgi:hypothetical protein